MTVSATMHRSPSDALVVSTVAAVVLATATLLRRLHRKSIQQLQHAQQENGTITHKLLRGEEIMYAKDEAPISTLTWFQGEYKNASRILKDRVSKILAKNPWLAGRLTMRGGGRLRIEYSSQQGPQLDDYYFELDASESPFSRDTPVLVLGSASRNILVANGPDQPLFRVTLCPCKKNPTACFAVVVSLSHVVGDGATFYKLHNMLCSNDDAIIKTLVASRIPTAAAQKADALGRAEFEFGRSFGFILNLVIGLIRTRAIGPAPHSQMVLLDDDKIRKAKEEEAVNRDAEVAWVSTNDIVTSWFLQQTGCDMGMMAVNFRNRLDGHSDEHAGNYEGALFYKREDSETPGLIRQSLLQMRRVVSVGDLPHFWQALTSSYSLVTNWSSFAKPNVIDGCAEEVHIPLYDVPSATPHTLAVCIIFRSGPQGIALYYGGQERRLRGVQTAPFFSSEQIK
mmetsp:Transcript_15908/g.30087  ORF Transcript_15908/g.30087 Transcript_15908/m.30087 type:complete len:454 (-) Transcript_15908:108-1469(-)|eukprot:CAMPEP_0197453768 /NCGR_PEP_ID=MMETSP1175-20131217/35939_1 /TAXON_ID=1003142 /ORGANISM="Triceratium dubium, Strain CCMP147" /LENGTH=453 /DNA_ID=CAMNT_0042987155 /DNA_START=69 /DNA_END=1430 /DNA_ORIENTATION=+